MAKTQKMSLGDIGEQIACRYLEEQGYKILERNHRQKWGEIDIIVKARDKTLVFVEVKTMRQYFGGLTPEDQMSASKIKKFKRTSSIYAGSNEELIDKKKGFRLDLIAILISDIGEAHNEDGHRLRHYENLS